LLLCDKIKVRKISFKQRHFISKETEDEETKKVRYHNKLARKFENDYAKSLPLKGISSICI